tara:strand:- start:223 stop:975 length:753 start_codon:yes stop_codon:yes gene_type:complete
MATPTLVGTKTNFASAAVGTSHTISHTVDGGGSNVGLFVIAYSNTGNNTAFTDCKWNGGSAMSQIVSVVGSFSGGGIMYFQAAPTSGTLNVVITCASKSCNAFVFQLQDVKQTSPVDATSAGAFSAGATSLNDTGLTTGTNGSLIINWGIYGSVATAITPAGSETEVAEFVGNSFTRDTQVQTLPKETAGAQTVGTTWTTSASIDMYTTSLLYQSSASTTVKTWNGIVRANLKSLNGTLSANIKKINGIT